MNKNSIINVVKIIWSLLPVMNVAMLFIAGEFIEISKETDVLRSTIGTIVIFTPIVWLVGMIISIVKLKITENKIFYIFNLAFNIPFLLLCIFLMTYPYN